MKHIHLIPLIAMVALAEADVMAYDLAVDNADGATIYYDIIDPTHVSVTYDKRFRATDSYAGHLVIPESITADGVTYQVEAVGDCAFFNCRALQSLSLPASVSSIGMRAFAWCDAISEISLPRSVSRIGANAFDGCYALTAINAQGGNDTYASDGGVLYSADMQQLVSYIPGREGRFDVADGTQAIADGAFGACTFLTDVALPQSLTAIGDNAFYFCNMLDGVQVPATVERIGKAAFADCFSMEYIDVDADNQHYASAEGALYDKGLTRLIQVPGAMPGALEMPDGVATIDASAGFRSYNLTTLKLPSTLKVIGEAAFVDCPTLASIEIPVSVDNIGSMAFAMCPNLTHIYVAAPDPKDIKLGEHVFVDVDTDVCTLYVPEGSEGTYASAPQWSDFKNISKYDALKEQSIRWDVDNDSILVGSAVTLNAMASSTLPVSYHLSAKCLDRAFLDDNVLAVIAEGTVTVTAYQPGNVEYKPAAPVTRTFDVVVSGIDDVETDDSIKVYGSYGAIVINGADPEDVAYVYDIRGMRLYSGTDRRVPVMPGCVYIVRIGARAYKVAVPQ